MLYRLMILSGAVGGDFIPLLSFLITTLGQGYFWPSSGQEARDAGRHPAMNGTAPLQ